MFTGIKSFIFGADESLFWPKLPLLLISFVSMCGITKHISTSTFFNFTKIDYDIKTVYLPKVSNIFSDTNYSSEYIYSTDILYK